MMIGSVGVHFIHFQGILVNKNHVIKQRLYSRCEIGRHSEHSCLLLVSRPPPLWPHHLPRPCGTEKPSSKPATFKDFEFPSCKPQFLVLLVPVGQTKSSHLLPISGMRIPLAVWERKIAEIHLPRNGSPISLGVRTICYRLLDLCRG